MTIVTSLSASDSHWEGVILEKILFSISKEKNVVIYTEDENIVSIIKKIKHISISKDCKDADYVLNNLNKLNSSCKKPEIVFDYSIYRKDSNAICVFFWQKGRPTIRFSAKRLQNFGLKVNGELSKFVSSKN